MRNRTTIIDAARYSIADGRCLRMLFWRRGVYDGGRGRFFVASSITVLMQPFFFIFIKIHKITAKAQNSVLFFIFAKFL